MSGSKRSYRKKLTPEQQDFVLELIAEENGPPNNNVIIQRTEQAFGVALKPQSVQYYRGQRFRSLIAKKRDVNNETIKAKVALANRLNRVQALADLFNDIKWRLSGVVQYRGRIIAEIRRKDFNAAIKCLEAIRTEMEPDRSGEELGPGGIGSQTINIFGKPIDELRDEELAAAKRRNEERLKQLGFVRMKPKSSRLSGGNGRK